MMTMAEVKMRVAHMEWLEAKKAWGQALANINVAKVNWESAQAEFYGTSNAMSNAAGCGGCNGCSTGKGCQ